MSAAAASVAVRNTAHILQSAVSSATKVAKPATVVACNWWHGKYDGVIDPSRFVIDGKKKLSSVDLLPGSDFARDLTAKYDDVGLVHVKNTGLTDMADQRAVARLIMGAETEYEGGANPRGRQGDLANVYDIGAPLEAHLHYHHEMTYKSHSCKSLAFLCKHALDRPGAGWTFCSDSVQAHDAIMQTPLGQKLKDKGLCFVRRMTDATSYPNTMINDGSSVYNHWQKSWMSDDPAIAQVQAETQNLRVEWKDDGRGGRMMETRFYQSAFEYVDFLDRNIMVTSIADDGEWFDSWPGIMDVPQEDRPLEMFWGDDTPITLQEKQEWTDTYDRFGIPIPWQDGDVAVVCNMRFAHGRPGVKLLPGEKRELGVMLGPMFERKEAREDKW